MCGLQVVVLATVYKAVLINYSKSVIVINDDGLFSCSDIGAIAVDRMAVQCLYRCS